MRLSELLTPDRVRVPLRPGSSDDVLRQLVELALPDDTVERDDVLRRVREREGQLSTGIGGGVAIPHARSDVFEELRLVAGCAAEPVEFQALDGAPVSLFFLLLAPEEDRGAHISALSSIARLLRKPGLSGRLASIPDAATFIRVLREAESA